MMARILPRLSIILTLLLPGYVFALGVGPIKVHSALNQVLNAEIELLSVDGSELDNLTITLGSARAFAQSGLARPTFLTDLSFSVHTSNGRRFVKVSSKRPIREPALNFLMDLEWSKGRLVREFVVFLDPSSTVRRTAVAAPATLQPKPQPRRSSTRKPKASRPSAPPPAPPLSGESYGPVASGETLWSIAKRLRPNDSVSVNQMMRALWAANPKAFIKADMNKLMAGVSLNIPLIEGASAAPRQARRAAPTSSAQANRAAETPQVRLVPPESVEGQTLPSVSEGLSNRSASSVVAEPFLIQLESGRPQLKVVGLDELRQRMGTLVGVDDGALTAIQEEEPMSGFQEEDTSVSGTETMATAQPEMTDTSAQPEVTDTSSQPEMTDTSSQPEMTDTSSQPEMTDTSAQPEMTDTTTSKPTPAISLTDPSTWTAIPGMVTEAASDAMGESMELLEDPMKLLDDPMQLLDKPRALALPLGALILLIGLPWMLIRRRRKSQDLAPESEDGYEFETIVQAKKPAETPPSPMPLDLDTVASGQPAETEPLPRASVLDAGSSKLIKPKPFRPASNPLERVDLLLAVGNFQEAERIARETVTADASNVAAGTKLLDVYFATGEKEKFLEQAQALDENLVDKSDNHLWQHVVDMGQQLCPEQDLFATSETEMDAGMEEVSLAKDRDSTVVVDATSRFEAAAVRSEETPESLDFEWGDSDKQPATETPVVAPQVDDSLESELQGLSFDFDDDLSSPEIDQTSSEVAFESSELEKTENSEPDEDFMNMDSHDFFTADTAAPIKDDDQGLAAELGSMDFDIENVEPAKTQNLGDDIDLLSSNEDDTFFLSDATEEMTTIDPVSEESELSGIDEDSVETKLDLADAYLAMQDAEGARSLLDEVLQEGSGRQQQRAKELMQRLS